MIYFLPTAVGRKQNGRSRAMLFIQLSGEFSRVKLDPLEAPHLQRPASPPKIGTIL
jgi:hypothetical protein